MTAAKMNALGSSLVTRGFRAVCRLLANHCPIPRLRHAFFRLSGFQIGCGAFLNMGINAVDSYASGQVILGARVAVAPNVTFVTESNPNNSRLREKRTLVRKGPIIVGDDAWIGAGVVILPGVEIGESAIIGANAVVTKKVEPYTIVAGIPARTIGDVRQRS